MIVSLIKGYDSILPSGPLNSILFPVTCPDTICLADPGIRTNQLPCLRCDFLYPRGEKKKDSQHTLIVDFGYEDFKSPSRCHVFIEGQQVQILSKYLAQL